MRRWLWIAMGLMLLVLCLGAAVAALQQKSVFGSHEDGAAVEDASSVSFSRKGKGAFSTDSLTKYAQNPNAQIPQAKGSVPTNAANPPEHAVNNVGFDITYPLMYDANGGAGTLATRAEAERKVEVCSSQHASGETVTLPTAATSDCWGSEPTRDGMKFVGWSTTKLAPFDTLSDAEAHVVGTMTMPESPQTLYAVWVRTVHTVTFKTQMDSSGVAGWAITLKTDSVPDGGLPSPPSDPVPYNQGLKFMGWGVSKNSSDATGEGEMTSFDTTAPVYSDETVWALWGYEDTAVGHKCVMGVDTVATCFPDAALQQTLIHGAQANVGLQVSDVWTQRDALFFGHLNCNSDSDTGDTPLRISELDGLQTLTGLGQLHISNVDGHTLNAHSRDLHQLKYLDKMNNLFANGDGVTDLSNLSGLTQLIYLHLSDNGISDVSVLSGLTLLTNLDLSDNGISDVSVLSGLTLLTNLDLSENSISNVGALSGLTDLTDLDLSKNNISDVSDLSGLTLLTDLNLSDNDISDVGALSSLTDLITLRLADNGISDVSHLSRLPDLQTLDLNQNHISDLSGLISTPAVELTNLKELDLNNNAIVHVSPLAKLITLSTLKLKDNHIQSIASWTSFTGMCELYLDNNEITDISVINKTNFQWLDKLGLSANQFSNISSLSDMTTLTQLWLHHNQISDVSPLAGLTGLTTLYIGSNHILDISPLKNLTGLSGGTNNSCDVDNSSFCADKQDVTVPQRIADPGVSMPTAVTLKKAADGSVAGASVDSTSIHSTTPGARFDAEHRQLTWDGPMQYNNDDSPKSLTQTFSAQAQLPNTIGDFSGTITESYKVAWHTVTFEPDGGTLPSEQPSTMRVHSGYKIAAPTSKPSRDGYRFMGWTCAADVAGVCHQGDSFDFANTAVTKDVTLTAKWQELAVALPLTGASYHDDLWRGVFAAIALGLALSTGLLRRRAAGR